MTLIGKTYIPTDNSYTKNLTGTKTYFLAGTLTGLPPKQTRIVSEPYMQEVDTVGGRKKEIEVINVSIGFDIVMVMYDADNVDRDLSEAIRRNQERMRIANEWGL